MEQKRLGCLEERQDWSGRKIKLHLSEFELCVFPSIICSSGLLHAKTSI
jgi:hypothetical protein